MDLQVMGYVNTVMSLKQINFRNQVGTSILRKSLDQQISMAEKLLSGLPEPVRSPQHLGKQIDISV